MMTIARDSRRIRYLTQVHTEKGSLESTSAMMPAWLLWPWEVLEMDLQDMTFQALGTGTCW